MSKCFVISSSWYFIIVLTCLVVAVVQLLSFVRLCNTMNCSMPGFPVLHHLLEFTRIHIHGVGELSKHLIPCRLFVNEVHMYM